VNLLLDGAQAARLLAPWPALAARVDGAVQLHLLGSLGREWRGFGVAVVPRARVFGVEIQEGRFPFRARWLPRFGSGALDVAQGGARAAGGRLTGRLGLRYQQGLHLEGQVSGTGLQLPTLLRELGEPGPVEAGRLSGKVDFAGRNVRGGDDVTAAVEATAEQLLAFQLPVLRQLSPYLVPGRLTTPVRRGELRGRLDRGVFRVRRLTLTGRLLQVFADGTVTTRGKLDLTVTANSEVLARASSYLSNRVVYLRVGGTVRNPQVRVEALPLLRDEVVRFLFDQAAWSVP
jgi:translocation and assembly module TamB